MNRIEPQLQDTIAAFRATAWHDSQLLGVNIEPSSDDLGPMVTMTLNLRQQGGDARPARLIMVGCRAVLMNVDLLGKELCGNQIASAVCEEGPTSTDPFVDEIVGGFDLYPGATVDDHFVIRVRLIHPGGHIIVIAKSFSLVQAREG